MIGDINLAHEQVDVHPKWNIEEIYSEEERAWMDSLLTEYVDLFRHFHPEAKDVYSVWDQKTDARIHNEGVRIDHTVCDRGFLPQVVDAGVVKMVPKKWSDHAALTLTLQEQPALPLHPPPAISSRNMKQFQEDQRQTKLTALFSRGVAASTETLVTGDRRCASEASLGKGGNSATSICQPAAGEDTGVDGRESPAPGPAASVKQQEDGGAEDRIGETKLGADVASDDSPCPVSATAGGKPVGAITCARKPAIQAPKKGRGSNKRKEAPVASSKQKSLRSFFKETNPASS